MAGQAVKTHRGQAIRFPVASSQLPAYGNPKLETGTRRGQASIEMLATVGIVLLLLLPLLMLLLVGAQVRFESLSQIQASSVARILADSINEVYLEGKGATKVALVNLPSNTKSITFSDNEVIVLLETGSGPTQITYPFFGRVSEATLDLNITDRRGLMPITFYVKDEQGNAVVNVDYAK